MSDDCCTLTYDSCPSYSLASFVSCLHRTRGSVRDHAISVRYFIKESQHRPSVLVLLVISLQLFLLSTYSLDVFTANAVSVECLQRLFLILILIAVDLTIWWQQTVGHCDPTPLSFWHCHPMPTSFWHRDLSTSINHCRGEEYYSR